MKYYLLRFIVFYSLVYLFIILFEISKIQVQLKQFWEKLKFIQVVSGTNIFLLFCYFLSYLKVYGILLFVKKNGMVELKYTPGSILYKGKSDKQYLAHKENKKNRSMEQNIMAKQHFSNGIVYCSSAWHDYPCLLLSLFRDSDVALPNWC